jgi:hypothetical protein
VALDVVSRKFGNFEIGKSQVQYLPLVVDVVTVVVGAKCVRVPISVYRKLKELGPGP